MDNEILVKIAEMWLIFKFKQQETERFQDLLIELIADIYDKLEDLGVNNDRHEAIY